MAASDNYAAAAADLRRLAALDEATLRGALAYMGREPFRRLRRAVGCTPTPEPSDDEGGSGPAGAQASSSPYRLDPAVNAENQVTASSEANVNNLDPALGDSFLAAVSSPTASMATQDPVWPPASGGPTSLESYLGEQPEDTAAAAGGTISSSAPTAGPTSMSATAPTTQRADPDPVLPTAMGAEQTVRQLADQIDGAAKPSIPGAAEAAPGLLRTGEAWAPEEGATRLIRGGFPNPALQQAAPPRYCALRIAGRPAGPAYGEQATIPRTDPGVTA